MSYFEIWANWNAIYSEIQAPDAIEVGKKITSSYLMKTTSFKSLPTWLVIGLLSALSGMVPTSVHAQTNAATDVTDVFAPSTNSSPPDQVNSSDDEGTSSPAQMLKDWRAEHDPVKRRAMGANLLGAVVMNQDDYGQPFPSSVDVAAEVARDGVPRNLLLSPNEVRTIRLKEITTLHGARGSLEGEAGSPPPVFRRISVQRVEVWTQGEGWLFDQHGRLLANAHVPHGGSNESQWYGAFLPDGQWITSYWSGDNQLNSYTRDSQWRWELLGQETVTKLPPPLWDSEKVEWPIAPTIAWARADKTGSSWEVGLGQDFSRGFVLVDPNRGVTPMAADANIWSQVYPRSMGVRGNSITQDFIPSDDGKKVLTQASPMHGPWVDWESYTVSDWGKIVFSQPDGYAASTNVVIYNGTFSFGFWPHSYCTYMESKSSDKKPVRRVWFFDATGKYEGEVMASRLGDAANDRDLLVQDANGHILQITRTNRDPKIVDARAFTWPDGTPAIPVAIYDDLRYGFFIHGRIMAGDKLGTEDASASIALGKW